MSLFDQVAGPVQGEPLAAELRLADVRRVAGAGVADVGVERVPGVGELTHASDLDRADQRALDARPERGCAGAGDHRPDACAAGGRGAAVVVARVAREDEHRVPAPVYENAAECRVADLELRA